METVTDRQLDIFGEAGSNPLPAPGRDGNRTGEDYWRDRRLANEMAEKRRRHLGALRNTRTRREMSAAAVDVGFADGAEVARLKTALAETIDRNVRVPVLIKKEDQPGLIGVELDFADRHDLALMRVRGRKPHGRHAGIGLDQTDDAHSRLKVPRHRSALPLGKSVSVGFGIEAIGGLRGVAEAAKEQQHHRDEEGKRVPHGLGRLACVVREGHIALQRGPVEREQRVELSRLVAILAALGDHSLEDLHVKARRPRFCEHVLLVVVDCLQLLIKPFDPADEAAKLAGCDGVAHWRFPRTASDTRPGLTLKTSATATRDIAG